MSIATIQKGIRQPLGSLENVNRVISGVPPSMALEETRNLKIIYAKRKLQVEVPLKWTVNKVKCMFCTHFDILQFDKFEFQCDKMLIPGKTQVRHLPDDELIVTKADCPRAFERFYSKTVKKVIKKYNITTQSTLMPILSKEFSQAMTYKIPKGRRKNLEQIPQNRNARNPEQEGGAVVMNILRVIGLAFMANIVFSFATYWQIGVLIFIFCLYYAIDEYVKINERRRAKALREAQKRQEEENKRKEEERKRAETEQQNNLSAMKRQEKLNEQIKREEEQIPVWQGERKASQMSEESVQERDFNRKYSEGNESNASLNEQEIAHKQEIQEPQMEQKPERKVLRAKLRLWVAFLVETVYCYVLSIFPNWTVETHLHANQESMDKVMDEVKQLDPEASEQVKKWQIKPKMAENQVEQVDEVEGNHEDEQVKDEEQMEDNRNE